MEEGKHGPYEYHLIMKDGSLIPFEVTSGVLRAQTARLEASCMSAGTSLCANRTSRKRKIYRNG